MSSIPSVANTASSALQIAQEDILHTMPPQTRSMTLNGIWIVGQAAT